MDIKARINDLISRSPSTMSEDYNLIDKLSLSILSLIHREIEKAIPKEKDSGDYDNDYAVGQADGFNICISDIRKALKDKGLL